MILKKNENVEMEKRYQRFCNFIKTGNDVTIFIAKKLYESTFSTVDIIFHKVQYELIKIYISMKYIFLQLRI